jgi:hypothetical protein
MLAPRQKSKGDVIRASAQSAHHIQLATCRGNKTGAVARLYSTSERRVSKVIFPLYTNMLIGRLEGDGAAVLGADRYAQPTAQLQRLQR